MQQLRPNFGPLARTKAVHHRIANRPIASQGVAAQNFRLTVYFKGDVLEKVDSDVLPSESDFAGRLVRPQAVGKLPALQASEEDLKKFVPAASATRTDAPAAPTAPAAVPRSYPPLEPAVR